MGRRGRAKVGAVVLVVLAAFLVGRPRQASATEGELGPTPWFPSADPEKTPLELLEQNTLAIIRIGEQGWRANRGRYRASLTRRDFYLTVGRGDLAERQAASNATSRTLTVTGVAGIGIGVLLLYAHFARGGLEPGLLPGLVVFGGGVAAYGASAFVTGPSVSADEAEVMIRRYNERLKLHIEDETGTRKEAPIQASRPRLFPWTDGRTGAGVMAVAVF
jgi:hypothetical protein